MQDDTDSPVQGWRGGFALLSLVIAGEAIFALPFVLPRVFRPTLLDVFGLTNLELGWMFSVYGVLAMIAYGLGGPLADRFSPRRMMAIALASTAAGGAVLSRVPGPGVLAPLYAWWGLTTILLFWAPLIRATRELGGAAGQGRAFGLLDGGRGLLAAGLASLAVALFGALLPVDAATASLAARRDAFVGVIWLFTGLTALAAALVCLALPESAPRAEGEDDQPLFAGLAALARTPIVWLHAALLVCAYIGYKSIDDVSLYARDVLDYDDVEAARIGAIALWLRPIAALGAGVLADRTEASRVMSASFVVMILGCLMLAANIAVDYGSLVLVVGTTSAGVYSLRGVYFALFAEARVRFAHTGAAVGLVSLIGYTPDVFMGPLMGWILDANPGVTGHQLLFMAVGGVGVLGFVCSLIFRRLAAPPCSTG